MDPVIYWVIWYRDRGTWFLIITAINRPILFRSEAEARTWARQYLDPRYPLSFVPVEIPRPPEPGLPAPGNPV